MRVRLAMNLASLQATAFPETLRRATDIPFFCLAQKGDVQVCLFIIDAACQKNKRKENVYLSFSFSFSFFLPVLPQNDTPADSAKELPCF